MGRLKQVCEIPHVLPGGAGGPLAGAAVLPLKGVAASRGARHCQATASFVLQSASSSLLQQRCITPGNSLYLAAQDDRSLQLGTSQEQHRQRMPQWLSQGPGRRADQKPPATTEQS